MASLTSIALARQVPYEPAEVPDPGEQSMGTQEVAARTGELRDPEQAVDRHNRLVPIVRQGPTTGPDVRGPGVDRPAMARDVSALAPWHGPEMEPSLGTHVEQVPGVDMPQGAVNEAPFAPRRNTFRVPPGPADANLILAD